jgi:hypothetical protein
MTIKATYQALQAVANAALPTFTFYGMYKDQYNTVKSISDGVIVIEPPRQWPINHRNTCQAYFDAKVWIGIRQSIKPATGGTYEYPPFNEIDIRDTLHTAATTFVNAVNNYSTLQVLGDFNGTEDLMTLMDAPEGGSTNWQAWGYFTIKVVSYGSSGSYTPPVYAPGLTFVTQYTMLNGATLPTGLQLDYLFIDTGVIDTDISSTAEVVTVPAGYRLVSACYRIVTDDVLSNIRISNIETGLVFHNDADYNQPVVFADPVASVNLPVTSFDLTAEGITSTDTIRAILKFERVQP